MKISSLGYLMGQGLRNMVSNKLMTIASIGVLTACLFITGVAALLSLNVNNYVEYLSAQNTVEIYLVEDLSEDAIIDLRVKIETLDNVSSCEYITKEMALEEMKVLMGEDADLLTAYEGEGNTQNPLPASLRAKISNLEFLTETVSEIENITQENSYRINVPENLTQILLTIQKTVTYVGWGLVAVLGIVSVVIISNTIRLTVFSRRKEINIMKYVGATNAFIRLPFFIEGMTVGAISGLLALGLVGGGYYALIYSANSADSFWHESIVENLLPIEFLAPYFAVGFIAFGIIIGGIGCASSIRKHLKV